MAARTSPASLAILKRLAVWKQNSALRQGNAVALARTRPTAVCAGRRAEHARWDKHACKVAAMQACHYMASGLRCLTVGPWRLNCKLAPAVFTAWSTARH